MSQAIHIETIKKSQNKMTRKIKNTNTTYGKCRSTRPFILKILRHFDDMESDIRWSDFLKVAYNKVTTDFLPVLNTEITVLEDTVSFSEKYQYQVNYLKKFKKNILKLKKKCEETTIDYYNYLPGYKIPLDIRSHIIGFISLTQ